jgi:predicted CXXCH cytochrome family protein
MLKHETVNQQCYSCHADKRGPFVFSHPPVEENCLTCHTPHGSSHGKLLADKAPNLARLSRDWEAPDEFLRLGTGMDPAERHAEHLAQHALHRALLPQLP